MVLLERIELSTSPLPRVRSTTELQQRWIEARAIGHRGTLVKRAAAGQAPGMKGQNDKTTREERLAAKLRENLKRRKAQARAQRPDDSLPKKPERG
jgi:hypothetical protein